MSEIKNCKRCKHDKDKSLFIGARGQETKVCDKCLIALRLNNFIARNKTVPNNNELNCSQCNQRLAKEYFDKKDDEKYYDSCRVCLFKIRDRRLNLKINDSLHPNLFSKLCKGCDKMKLRSDFPRYWKGNKLQKRMCTKCITKDEKYRSKRCKRAFRIFNTDEEMKTILELEAKQNPEPHYCKHCEHLRPAIQWSRWKGGELKKNCTVCGEWDRDGEKRRKPDNLILLVS